MDDIQYQALCEFKGAAERDDPEYILEIQKTVLSWQAKRDKRLRRKLKNPVHYHTGKPLNKRTIQKYKAEIEQTKRHLAALEIAIEMLKKYNVIGNGKKSINEILESYEGKETPEDKPYLDILREIQGDTNERRAHRARMIHMIKTCQEDCPCRDFCKLILQID